MTGKRFGYYISRDDGLIDGAHLQHEIKPEVFEEFERIIAVTSELRPFVINFLSLEANFAALAAVPDDLKSEFEKMTNPLSIGGVDQSRALAKAQGAVSNFLSSASSFRERALTRLRERYGNDSLQVRQLEAIINDCYVGWLAYRLLYNLRNFEQHHDMPLSLIPVSGKRNESGEMEFQVSLELHPKMLLTSSRVQARFAREELVNLVDPLNLIPLSSQYMQLHGGMMKAIIDMQVERLMELQAYGRTVLQKLKIPKGAIPVIWEGDPTSPRYYHFSFDELGLLNKMHNALGMPEPDAKSVNK